MTKDNETCMNRHKTTSQLKWYKCLKLVFFYIIYFNRENPCKSRSPLVYTAWVVNLLWKYILADHYIYIYTAWVVDLLWKCILAANLISQQQPS